MHNPFTDIGRLPKSLRLGIAPHGIALLQSSGWWKGHTRVLAECALPSDTASSFDAAMSALRGLLTNAACTNQPITIVITDQWTRLFMVTPPHNTTKLRDCQAAAAMRFQELYGDNIHDWKLSADWKTNQPFLACAMPAPLLDTLGTIAKEHRLTMLSVVPQFIAAWNQWCNNLDGSSWFGVAHDNLLTIAAIDKKRLRAIHTMQVPQNAWQDLQWLPGHLTKQALRFDLPIPDKLKICGYLANCTQTKSQLSPRCLRLDVVQASADASAAVQLARTGESQ